ncbi:MAG: hypothetical protein IPF52_03000, partial [Saprospiraceae bacterium]|nr:hypothetical protein [Saprospiraceae bacterium]
GETVKLCVDFNYDPSETGSDWFHGLVPDFGYGWDLDNFNPDNIESVPSGATWFDENDPNCFPRTSRSVPLLCTYRDKYNNLRLCNFKCEVCPCSTGLRQISTSSGWFWNTPGGQGCGVLCPSLSYGLPRNDFEAQNIRLCMTLKTKSILKINNDFENLDLKISFNTTSMSITGCWDKIRLLIVH